MRRLNHFNTTDHLNPQISLWFGINATYVESSLKIKLRVTLLLPVPHAASVSCAGPATPE